MGRPLWKNEIPLQSVNSSLPFEIWAIDFVRPFPQREKRIGAKYIITAVEYVTKWEEAEPVESCTKEVATKFIYENIITRFGCPVTLISDQGTHFVNETIQVLLKKFLIDHRKTTAYHPQANGVVESFNKTLHKGLTKICGIDKNEWDDKVPAVLWAYRSAYKRSTGQTPFKLVYGQEVVIPLHFWANSDRVASVSKFDQGRSLNDRLYQLNKLEEGRLIEIHHQEVQKQQQKAWHDRHLKKKEMNNGDLVLLYDSRVKGKPRKLETTWLGPYIIEDIRPTRVVQLQTLLGHPFKKLINGAHLKKYNT
jgi:hypothetical protein